jgi:hypothetical protein
LGNNARVINIPASLVGEKTGYELEALRRLFAFAGPERQT